MGLIWWQWSFLVSFFFGSESCWPKRTFRRQKTYNLQSQKWLQCQFKTHCNKAEISWKTKVKNKGFFARNDPKSFSSSQFVTSYAKLILSKVFTSRQFFYSQFYCQNFLDSFFHKEKIDALFPSSFLKFLESENRSKIRWNLRNNSFFLLKTAKNKFLRRFKSKIVKPHSSHQYWQRRTKNRIISRFATNSPTSLDPKLKSCVVKWWAFSELLCLLWRFLNAIVFENRCGPTRVQQIYLTYL